MGGDPAHSHGSDRTTGHDGWDPAALKAAQEAQEQRSASKLTSDARFQTAVQDLELQQAVSSISALVFRVRTGTCIGAATDSPPSFQHGHKKKDVHSKTPPQDILLFQSLGPSRAPWCQCHAEVRRKFRADLGPRLSVSRLYQLLSCAPR